MEKGPISAETGEAIRGQLIQRHVFTPEAFVVLVYDGRQQPAPIRLHTVLPFLLQWCSASILYLFLSN
ncbi:hypothetical protein BDW68DRAFT_156280 [Aspergillus falconensis]